MSDVVQMLAGHPPCHVIKLQLWIEDDHAQGFGGGRIELLRQVGELGSLSKAAKALSMSYRAAWGKIKKAEQIMGTDLVEAAGSKRDGYRLTPVGKALVIQFSQWCADVELYAQQRAATYFPISDEEDKKPCSV